jgi:hypothetical protein
MGLSQHVPDRQKWRRISTGQAPLFGKTGQPSACIPIKHPMTKSDTEREKEGRMTRKFLMTVAIVAIALAPSIGIGPAQAHGFGGGFGGGGFHGGGFGGRGFYGGYGVVFTAGMVASIRATMGMAIPRTVTTATDRVQLAAGTTQLCHEAKGPPARGALDFQSPTFSSSCWRRIPQRGDAGLASIRLIRAAFQTRRPKRNKSQAVPVLSGQRRRSGDRHEWR